MTDLSNEQVSDDRLVEMLAQVEDKGPLAYQMITPPLLRSILAELQQLRSAADTHRCFICNEPFQAGQMVLPDVNEGLGHRECFGEDREAYVKDTDTGEPLGPDDPIPAGEPYDPTDYAPAQRRPVAFTTQAMLDALQEPDTICGTIWPKAAKLATIPLFSLAQLQAAERERDEAWAARNENAKLKGQRDASLAKLKAADDSIVALRKIVSECAAALPNGAFISPDASVEFMAKLPAEIASVCARPGAPYGR